ncbi:MAG: thioredoxin family protein [Burkholderiales bacterium]
MKLAKALALVAALAAGVAAGAETRDAEDHFFNLNGGDLRLEAGDARSSGKKALLFMFEQDGCPGCIYMKHNVLNRVDVQRFYHERFLNFSINTFGSVPIKDFGGRDLTEKSFAQSVGIKATPTFLFYDLAGNELVRIIGPVRDAGDFMLLGEFVASGAYKTRKFAEYLQQRKSKGS